MSRRTITRNVLSVPRVKTACSQAGHRAVADASSPGHPTSRRPVISPNGDRRQERSPCTYRTLHPSLGSPIPEASPSRFTMNYETFTAPRLRNTGAIAVDQRRHRNAVTDVCTPKRFHIPLQENRVKNTYLTGCHSPQPSLPTCPRPPSTGRTDAKETCALLKPHTVPRHGSQPLYALWGD